MYKPVVVLLLTAVIPACSPQHEPRKHPQRPVPEQIRMIHQISQQTSYSLFDCDTTISEVRAWKLESMISPKKSLFLKGHTAYSQQYYLAANSYARRGRIKIAGIATSQERVLDKAAEEAAPMFFSHGGPALTCREGVEVVIDSLFRMGFAKMQSQTEEESLQVGDGTEYIIEVRRGNYYKYVYYHSPEYFKNAPAQKFITVFRFLALERLRILSSPD